MQALELSDRYRCQAFSIGYATGQQFTQLLRSQVTKLNLEMKPAQNGLVETIKPVGSCQKYTIEALELERFNGVFLATTNRFDSLDKAILRRFHLKVEFGYLRPEQLRKLLACCVPDAERLTSVPVRQLERLHSLTPGLVKAALQGLHISGRSMRLASLLEALQIEQDQQLDGVTSRSIGFVQ